MPDAPPPSGGGAALDELRRAAEVQPHGTILVTGPASPERRRLLEALPAQLGARFTSVWLEGSELSPATLWMRITEALGVTPGYDARRRVLQLVEDLVLRSGALLVIVPHAESMAGDSLASLVNNARTERGLHVVLASTSARALGAALPEDATVVAWDGAPLAQPQPQPQPKVRAPARTEAAAEPPTIPAPEIAPDLPRRAVREERRSVPARGLAVLLATGLALFLAWSLYPSGSGWSPESEPVATRAPSPAPEREAEPPRTEPPSAEPPREAAAVVDPAGEATAASHADPLPSEPAPTAAPEATAAPAPAPPEPAPRAEPTADAEVAEAPSETAAAPQPPAPPTPEPDTAPPPEPVAPPPSEPAAAPPAEPRPVEPEVARARTPAEPRPQAPAPPPLARGRLRVDSEVPVRIEIDGRPHGRTPLDGVRLPRGQHRVVARYPDGASALKSVTLGDEDVAIFFR